MNENIEQLARIIEKAVLQSEKTDNSLDKDLVPSIHWTGDQNDEK